MLHHVEIVTERPKGEKEGKRDMTVNRYPSCVDYILKIFEKKHNI